MTALRRISNSEAALSLAPLGMRDMVARTGLGIWNGLALTPAGKGLRREGSEVDLDDEVDGKEDKDAEFKVGG